jgi:hypothetical protein
MRKILAVCSIALLSSSAFAQGGAAPPPAEKKAPEPAAKPADKPAAPPAAGMHEPKPAEQLQQLKGMVGSWHCEGKFTMGGQTMAMKSTAKFAWDLDNFFIHGEFDSPKSKENPHGYKGHAVYGYDGKQFVEMSVDNMGGMEMATSPGWTGDTQEWTGHAKMGGADIDTHTTITRKGDKEVHISSTMGAGAQAATEEMTCKK